MLNELNPEIKRQKARITENASSITEEDRRRITKKALRKLIWRNHRKNLVTLEGYTDKDRRVQVGKFVKSTILSAVTGFIANALVVGAIAYEIAKPVIHLGAITHPATLAIIAASYLLHYGMIYLNSKVNYHLLEKKNINTCPSITAKAAHYTTTRLLPEDPQLTKRAVFGGTAIFAVWQELLIPLSIILPIPFVQHLGLQALLARNAAGTVFNLGEVAGGETYIGYRGIRDKALRRWIERRQRPKKNN